MNEITRLMVNTAQGIQTADYSLADSDTSIRKYFESELGIPAGCKDMKTIRKALRRNKVRFFEIIEETVEELLTSGWRDNEFFNTFVEFRNLALGDENLFYVEDESILTVAEVAEGTNELIRQKLGAGREYSVHTKHYGIKIYDEYVRFQAGIVDWAGFVNKMYEAVDKKTNDDIYSAFMGLENIVPAGFGKTGALTKADVLELAEMVSIANGGAEVMICGTRQAISTLMGLTEAGWISNQMKEQRNTTGTVAYFEGVETMVVSNVFEKGTTTLKYPANKLYFLPKTDVKPIKYVWEGDVEYSEDTNKLTRRDQTMEAMIDYRAGIATVFGRYFGTYVFTTSAE